MKILKNVLIIVCFFSNTLWAGDIIDNLEAKLKTVSGKEKAKVLNQLAEVYYKKSPKRSLTYAEQSLKLAGKAGAQEEKAEALHYIGAAYKYLSDYDKALEYHLESLKIWENIGDKKGIAKSLHNIGNVYDYLKKYDEALEYHHKALKIRENGGDKEGKAHSLHNIGVIYHQLNRYTKALEYYKRGLEIRKEINDRRGIAGSLNNIGVVYKHIINYADSLDRYLEALEIFEELGDLYEIANISNNIGELYLKLDNYDEAFSYLDRGLKIARRIEAKELIRENHAFYSDVYAAKGKYEKSLEYYKLSSQMKDRIFTEESSKKIADMQAKYETEKKEKEIELLRKDSHIQQLAFDKKEKEIELLRKDNRIQQLALGKQKLLRNSLLAGFFFVLILAFVVYNRYRLKKKAHAELEAAHNIITSEKAKSDKLLLNVLPVRVANDLKERGETEPESFDNVTVYFSDIVGFTNLSSQLEPRFLINELNDIFTTFDNIIVKNQCERIKTIGDAYLCVCGMPEKNIKHAENIINSSIEILHYLTERNRYSNIDWKIRIGIHTGKVVGGVVGIKKYIYDVFGDTINTASRMESNSEPMKINISQVTHEIVKDKFKFTERESIFVKGKGEMKMYFIDNDLKVESEKC